MLTAFKLTFLSEKKAMGYSLLVGPLSFMPIRERLPFIQTHKKLGRGIIVKICHHKLC